MGDGWDRPELFSMLTAFRDSPVSGTWPSDALSHGTSETRTEDRLLTEAELAAMRLPYALRRVPPSCVARLVDLGESPAAGDVALARLEKVGKNTRLELATGRPCALHPGDLLAVVFGNRYATMQFEGYARTRGESCDLLSMGGLCGVVESKHDAVSESTKLRLLGALADANGRRLRLSGFSLPPAGPDAPAPNLVVVCGTSMDAGKTYTAMSLIQGLRRRGATVAGIKLTGTAAGKDTWGMLDAGACVALDFVDGGFPSTFLTSLGDLLGLKELLVGHAAARGAQWVVMEIADGLLQSETAALLQCEAFTRSVFAWVFAAGDPMSAAAGVRLMRDWHLEPVAVSGRVTMSALAMREAEAASGVRCYTAASLQSGGLASELIAASVRHGRRECAEVVERRS
jgi:hypothetical protein